MATPLQGCLGRGWKKARNAPFPFSQGSVRCVGLSLGARLDEPVASVVGPFFGGQGLESFTQAPEAVGPLCVGCGQRCPQPFLPDRVPGTREAGRLAAQNIARSARMPGTREVGDVGRREPGRMAA